MKHRQTVFRGLMVKFDKVDMNPEHTPDCMSVDITTKGKLSSMEGTEKQHTSGFTGRVNAIHQLDGEKFVLVGSSLWRL